MHVWFLSAPLWWGSGWITTCLALKSGITVFLTPQHRTVFAPLPPATPERCKDATSRLSSAQCLCREEDSGGMARHSCSFLFPSTARCSCSLSSHGHPAAGLPALLAKAPMASHKLMPAFRGSPQHGDVSVAEPPPFVLRLLANCQEQKLRQPVPVCGHVPTFQCGKPCDLARESLLPQGC